MKQILLTGVNGQLGWELQRTLAPLGKVTALNRQKLDLSNTAAIRSIVQTIKPHIIVNAAAYTAVDKAEEQADIAEAINGETPGVLAEEAKKINALLMHYSTDYVFDGMAANPYIETDATSPQSIYGRTKLAGEKAIQAVDGNYLIFRTSWVYGLRGVNFLKTMLRLAVERKELSIVSDQTGTPTWSRMLAETTSLALSKVLSDPNGLDQYTGTYHVSGAGNTSWFEFAEKIIGKAAKMLQFKPPIIKPIPTSAYPTPAPRPAYSVLDNSCFEKQFQLCVPHWEDQLDLCLQELPDNFVH